MDKKVLDTIADADARLMVSKIIDIANLSAKYHEPRFSHFLDPAIINICREKLRFDVELDITYWGGFPEAERQILCARPDWLEDTETEFPITLFRLSGYGLDQRSHRDYLGALMGLGIGREMVGDIIADDNIGYLFVCEEIARYIEMNLERVGPVSITIEKIPLAEFNGPRTKTEVRSVSVMSMRLDALLAAGLQLSRSKAAELVRAGRVQINHQQCNNLSAILELDDLVSVRGFGRFRIGEKGGTSRKGRTFLEIIRYI